MNLLLVYEEMPFNMIRTIPWIIFWVLTLFAIDISVSWTDGQNLELKGWASKLWRNK